MRRKAGGRGKAGDRVPGRAASPAAAEEGEGVAYTLRFKPAALREWDRLDASIQDAFEKVLEKRLRQPRVGRPMRGHPDRFRLKLREVGYRLVYEVREGGEWVVLVVAVGRRDSGIYDRAARR